MALINDIVGIRNLGSEIHDAFGVLAANLCLVSP